MINTTQHLAKCFAVARNTTHRNAAKVHTMIAALTPDQAGALAVAACTVIGKGDFKGGLNRFRTRVGVEHMIKVPRHDLSQTIGKLKRLGVTHLESWRIIQLVHLRLDRFDNFRTFVTSVAAPKTRRPIQDLAVVIGCVIHAFGRDQHTRGLLELAVGRKRHPECRKIVRPADFRGGCHKRSPVPFRIASLISVGGLSPIADT